MRILTFGRHCEQESQAKITAIWQTIYMEQSPSWEADSHSASLEITLFYGTRRFITLFTGVRHWILFQSQLNPVHTFYSLDADGGDVLQIWWVAVNILSKRLRTSDKKRPSRLWEWREANLYTLPNIVRVIKSDQWEMHTKFWSET
jgi:hypothetical protein